MKFITEYISNFRYVFSAMAPWLLMGYFLAGVIAFFLKPEQVKKHLGGRGMMPVLKAVLIGIPLPVCSCGVIPIAAALRNEGAEKSSCGAFFISTPQTGIDSVIVTASMMGWPLAVIRIVVALFSGLTGGMLISLLASEPYRSGVPSSVPEKEKKSCCCCCKGEKKDKKSIKDAVIFIFSYGFLRMMKSTGPSLLLGMFIAALVQQLLPADFGAKYLCGNMFLEFAVVLIFSIPLYICSSASVPVALTLILKGFSPGAALVFLVAGPTIHSVSITSMRQIIGAKAAILAIAAIALWAVIAGTAVNYFNVAVNIDQIYSVVNHHGNMAVKNICAVILALLICRAIAVKLREKLKKS